MITLTVIVALVVYVLESLFCYWVLTLPIFTLTGMEVAKGLEKREALKWGFIGTLLINIFILLVVGLMQVLCDIGNWMIANLP